MIPNNCYTRCITLSLLACLLWLPSTSCKKPEPPKEPEGPKKVKLLQVGPPKLLSTREFPGTVKALKTADLSFSISGKLIEFPAKKGMEVKKDTLLAKLDPRDFEANRDGVKANLETAKS